MRAFTIRAIPWLALLGLIGYLGLATAGLSLQTRVGSEFAGFSLALLVPFYFLLGLWVLIGAIVMVRRPENPVGWLLALLMPVVALDQLAFGYVAYEATTGAASTAGAVALVWLKWTGMPFGILVIGLALLLFPHVRFRSRPARQVAWTAVAGLLLYLPLKALEPGPLVLFPGQSSPLAVSPALWAWLAPFMWLGLGGLVLGLVAGLVSLLWRLRRAGREERQQIRWVILPALLFILGVPVVVAGGLNADGDLFRLGGGVQMIAVSSLIGAMAVAILRYRLYDLGLIVNRALVYSLLSLLLALIYFSAVVLLEQLLRLLTGRQSPLVVVVSTLLIAALFSPLRRRVQAFIDRRFYRRKYDAARTLAAFAIAARDEVDLEALAAALMGAVDETMQPAHSALWLAPVAGATGGRIPDA